MDIDTIRKKRETTGLGLSEILQGQRHAPSPPQFTKLVKTYEEDSRSSRLRLGQWFLVVFMPGENNPKLFYSTDRREQLEMIRKYYSDYQWP